MCSRFVLTCSPDALRAAFAFVERPDFPPRFNIAPTQPIAVVHALRADTLVSRHFALMRWGFLPSFVKAPSEFSLLINANAEGIEGKPSFRNALKRRRCLVPASAFYLWRRVENHRTARSQPFMCRRADGAPIALAGLYEVWVGPNGEEVSTACIVTTAANGVSAALHPRLPVVIEPDNFARWLDPDEAGTDSATALLKPPEHCILTFVPISDDISSVRHEGPSVQTVVGDVIRDAVPSRMATTPDQLQLF